MGLAAIYDNDRVGFGGANTGHIAFKARSGSHSLAVMQASTNADCDIAYYEPGLEAAPMRSVMSVQEFGEDYPYFGLFVDSAEKLTYKARTAAGATIGPETVTDAMAGGTVHTLIATNDGTNIRLYVDGVLAKTFADSGDFTGVDSVVFGALVGATVFHGCVGDIVGSASALTRALTPAQVVQLHRELLSA